MSSNDYALKQRLRAWRSQEAAKQGRALYHILHNASIDELVAKKPQTPLELLDIKGIAGTKINQYGTALLSIIQQHTGASGDADSPGSISPNLMPPLSQQNANTPWTDDDMLLLAHFAGEQKSVKFIAGVLGRSELAVEMRMQNYLGGPSMPAARRLDFSVA